MTGSLDGVSLFLLSSFSPSKFLPYQLSTGARAQSWGEEEEGGGCVYFAFCIELFAVSSGGPALSSRRRGSRSCKEGVARRTVRKYSG